ncbi:MAG TPA: carbohydrate binding domain-containing protein, partial [Candidatus Hydrogenedentes bacterium]|nr:carbohydrate binding domain-containing protein [Candidatus Hydrogenedentota bacterium]
LGSIAKDAPGDWIQAGGNLWFAGGIAADSASGPENLLANPGFEAGTQGWFIYTEGGAQASVAHEVESVNGSSGAVRIGCQASGAKPHHIQFYTNGIAIERGGVYRLTMAMRASEPCEISPPVLMKNSAPWMRYANPRKPHNISVTSEWAEHTLVYGATATAADGRLNFMLGGAVPAGVSLYLDQIGLERLGEGLIPRDVGNIVFNHGPHCGVKVWGREDLRQQDDYWYDEDGFGVYVYSAENPAERYESIECALRDHIIYQQNQHHILYENLACLYGAAHGIGGGSTHNIIVRDCDFGYIGGGDQMGDGRRVRFGNGVEFWGPAHDCLVERCRFWEIYDAAMTHQSSGDAAQYRIVYQNNLVWNCEYSFEYWNRPETSTTHHIWFINNTCLNAGHGWGHTQRPDPGGRHLCFYASPAQQTEFYIVNNIFYEAKTNAFYAPSWPVEQVKSLIMDHNCWYQAEGVMAALSEGSFTMAEFDACRTLTGLDAHSIVAQPGLVDAKALDFRLAPDSCCIDTGREIKALYPRSADFAGTPVPQGKAPDIGAYEFPAPTN